MANTITGLIPTIYTRLDTVARELTGLTVAVSRNMRASGAAKDQTITAPVAPAATGSDWAPAVTSPDTGDQTIGSVSMTISKARTWPIRWGGEQELALKEGGQYEQIIGDQFEQGFRAAVNEVETDLAALQIYASRAYGTAGTTPFGTANDYTDASKALQILKDNGAPNSDCHLVIDTNAGASFLGKQAAVNSAGTDSILRQGVLLDMYGMAVRESAQINTSTAGTAASATTNTAGYAIGATTITLAAAGTGTIVAGDVVTFAGDTRKYLVVTGDADVSNGGTIVLAAPGLRKAIPGSATAITVAAASARNMCFHRSAIVLATRTLAVPRDGDAATDRRIVTDPRTGLAFSVAMYPQYGQMRYEIGLAWGVKVVKPEFLALLLG